MSEFRKLAQLDGLNDSGGLCRLVGEISRAGPTGSSLLLSALTDESIQVRSSAARALARIGCGRRDVAEGLATALTDASVSVRREAAIALGVMEAKPTEIC